MTFADRDEAGRALAAALAGFRGDDVVVLGVPRGGVPVAAVVARALRAPLDVIVVRKLGLPSNPELAMGAIGEDGVRVLNESVVRHWDVSPEVIAEVEARERAELDRRLRRFREGHPPLELTGRTAIVVDDGVATGATARAACLVVRALGARRVVLAVPVASPIDAAVLREVADEVVCLDEPVRLTAVAQAYRDFTQVSDEEVVRLLAAHRDTRRSEAPSDSGGPMSAEVDLPISGGSLPGSLELPAGARSIVLFAHGSGSSRHSPRNQYVARRLNDAGLGTLLFDLLTSTEAQSRAMVFDVGLLGSRLVEATRWVRDGATLEHAVGYFGASTGAAAALWAAADPSVAVRAVVSRGGRPDLAGPRLPEVKAPTLFVVGGEDRTVLDLNERAQAMMSTHTALAVVPGAGHLFEEPGALDAVADLAIGWFRRYLGAPGSPQVTVGGTEQHSLRT